MKKSLSGLRMIGCVGGFAMVASVSTGVSQAQGADAVPPPMSYFKGQYFKKNPAAWTEYLAQLPARSAGAPEESNASAAAATAGGTWQNVTTNTGVPTNEGFSNPLLLTDGTVILAEADTKSWWKLTPDASGNYATGTWSPIASLPVIGGVQYAPQYFASAVLPDGRVIIMGGEYNGSNNPTWTNLGAIYDPVADAWTPVTAPNGWGYSNGEGVVGDSQSVMLPDGTFMLAGCCNNPAQAALLDASSLTWTFTGAPNAGHAYQDEQGYELLPSGNVLTIDIWTNSPEGGATNAEQYVPSAGDWISAGNTPVSLVDPAACGTWEIGPAVVRPNGTVVAFGGNTGCAAPKTDPTAIYNVKKGTWAAGKNVPSVCGRGGKTPCSLADAPAVMMPNGNILFAASSGYGSAPTHFFEYTATNAIEQVSDPVANASSSGAYYYNFLVLPNGQILMTDFTRTPEVYTPAGTPTATWAPTLKTVNGTTARLLKHGGTYTFAGTQFNGLTAGAYYGDDAQTSTNYPIVRITNKASGHVFFAKTLNPNTYSIAPGTASSVTVTVPENTELGVSTVAVIANGIASKALTVDVQ